MPGGAAAPARETTTDVVEATDRDTPWEVVVWDDPVNLMQYVVHVFRKVLGKTEEEATRLMLEVHNEGRSLVATEPRSTAQRYVRALQGHGLRTTMRRAA